MLLPIKLGKVAGSWVSIAEYALYGYYLRAKIEQHLNGERESDEWSPSRMDGGDWTRKSAPTQEGDAP